MEIEEIISYYAKRGDREIVQVLRKLLDNYEDQMYETESEEESEDIDMIDIIEEKVDFGMTDDGFFYLL